MHHSLLCLETPVFRNILYVHWCSLRGKLRHRTTGRPRPQGDKRDDEEADEVKGEVEEIRSNAHSAHET